MRRALVSVSDKTGLVDFVKGLKNLGWEIIATGGTRKLLEDSGVATIGISDVTGFPEILDGRVKTLHPKVHGGILARRDVPEHMKTLEEQGIGTIDLVCVNLYPFRQTISREGVSMEDAIENIDIGGPSMVRSAAKNWKDVTIVCDPSDYDKVLSELSENGWTSDNTRLRLSAKAYTHTAEYDMCIASWMRGKAGLNEKLFLEYDLVCVALKHMNPCGAAVGKTIEEAWQAAYEADKVSIYGGIVAVNRELTAEVALGMKPIFLEIVIAPSYTPEALEILSHKKNLRVMQVDMTPDNSVQMQYVGVIGGMLVQEQDKAVETVTPEMCVTKARPDESQMADLNFGWKIVKHVKSNAIVVVKDGEAQAAGFTENLVLASDGFLPFDDTVALAAQYGVTAIVQPGGSIRDADAVAKADELGITMLFTGVRHFKH